MLSESWRPCQPRAVTYDMLRDTYNINLLYPTGYVMHQKLNIQQL